MDLQTFMTDHPDLYQQVKRLVTVEEATSWDEAGAEALRAEGRQQERDRVVEIISAPGPEAVKRQAVMEGWDPKRALVAMLEARETARAQALADLAKAAPSPVGQTVIEEAVADLPLEKVAMQEWEKKPEVRREFGQFETYLAYRRAEAAGRAKILKKKE